MPSINSIASLEIVPLIPRAGSHARPAGSRSV